MLRRHEESSEYRRRLMDDVRHPKTWLSFDVEDNRVRHKSIGFLDDRYWQQPGGHETMDLTKSLAGRKDMNRDYTRIPPLATLSRDSRPLIKNAHKIMGYGLLGLSALNDFYIRTAGFAGRSVHRLNWWSKRYVVDKGLHTSLYYKVVRKTKWVLLLGIMAVALLAAALTVPKSLSGSNSRHSALKPGGSSRNVSYGSPSSGQINESSAATKSSNCPPKTSSTTLGGTTPAGTQAPPAVTSASSSPVSSPVSTPPVTQTPTAAITNLVNQPLVTQTVQQLSSATSSL